MFRIKLFWLQCKQVQSIAQYLPRTNNVILSVINKTAWLGTYFASLVYTSQAATTLSVTAIYHANGAIGSVGRAAAAPDTPLPRQTRRGLVIAQPALEPRPYFIYNNQRGSHPTSDGSERNEPGTCYVCNSSAPILFCWEHGMRTAGQVEIKFSERTPQSPARQLYNNAAARELPNSGCGELFVVLRILFPSNLHLVPKQFLTRALVCELCSRSIHHVSVNTSGWCTWSTHSLIQEG